MRQKKQTRKNELTVTNINKELDQIKRKQRRLSDEYKRTGRIRDNHVIRCTDLGIEMYLKAPFKNAWRYEKLTKTQRDRIKSALNKRDSIDSRLDKLQSEYITLTHRKKALEDEKKSLKKKK